MGAHHDERRIDRFGEAENAELIANAINANFGAGLGKQIRKKVARHAIRWARTKSRDTPGNQPTAPSETIDQNGESARVETLHLNGREH
jgi:hypothetical protein